MHSSHAMDRRKKKAVKHYKGGDDDNDAIHPPCSGKCDGSTGSSQERFTCQNDIQLSISNLSREKLSGSQVVELVNHTLHDVLRLYLPSISFLVHCELKLQAALGEHSDKNDNVSAGEFYKIHIVPLSYDFAIMRETLKVPAKERIKMVNELNELKELNELNEPS